MKHKFPKDISFEWTENVTDPFRYFPHESVKIAASLTITHIESDSRLKEAFSEGKMLGVLVCRSEFDNELCYLRAFSGNIEGKSQIDGFVPAIYDLTDPNGYFREKESEITRLNKRITELTRSGTLEKQKEALTDILNAYDLEIEKMRSSMAYSKNIRNLKRGSTKDPEVLSALIKESQHEKAEFKRLKLLWERKIITAKEDFENLNTEIRQLKEIRSEMSESLQNWIFSQYVVHNADGERATIAEIFSSTGHRAPGGTGECAAPKLLEYAYLNGLRPVAMGEFWYGKSPDTAVRTQGHFYPSCTSKCGPLLGFMLKGLVCNIEECSEVSPRIIHEDSSIIVVEKPGGMPSVPGLDKRTSLQEWLSERHGCDIYSVHRLDMDTSGIIVYAKNRKAESNLKKQFEEHTISKTYIARLSAQGIHDGCKPLKKGDSGSIELPISSDYDERPRQKVDYCQGKPALTHYKVLSENCDGTIDIMFTPITGRTHQLRVHSAHHLGLGRPIVGDRLYGGSESRHLHLKAMSIRFIHPENREEITYSVSSSGPEYL